jgi:hypothetical protein
MISIAEELKSIRNALLKIAGFQSIRDDAACVRNDMRLLVELNGELLSHQIKAANPRYADPLRLLGSSCKHFSQNDEDGIIEEIFRRIGTDTKFFVEFGSGNGRENNTLYLLLKGWQGCWIDGSEKHIADCAENAGSFVKSGHLRLKNAMITVENIEQLFRTLEVPEQFDLLSIDVDGNDFHLWQALSAFRPRVVVMEYNAILGPEVDAVMQYNPSHVWDLTTRFGASLLALEKLGTALGYCLVGCNFNGINSFFVRKDLVNDQFCQPYTAANHYEPFRYPRIAFASPYAASIQGFVDAASLIK